MRCEICCFEFTKIYKLPLKYCINCFSIYYEKKYESQDVNEIKIFTENYSKKNGINNINCNLSFDLYEIKNIKKDTLMVVYNTDFLLSENFNKCSYVFNDYSSCYFFNYNSIKLLTQKNKFNITYIKKIDKYTVFGISKEEENIEIQDLLYDEIVKHIYEKDIIDKFYLKYLYFKNSVQNKMIEKVLYKESFEFLSENKKKNYKELFFIF